MALSTPAAATLALQGGTGMQGEGSAFTAITTMTTIIGITPAGPS